MKRKNNGGRIAILIVLLLIFFSGNSYIDNLRGDVHNGIWTPVTHRVNAVWDGFRDWGKRRPERIYCNQDDPCRHRVSDITITISDITKLENGNISAFITARRSKTVPAIHRGLPVHLSDHSGNLYNLTYLTDNKVDQEFKNMIRGSQTALGVLMEFNNTSNIEIKDINHIQYERHGWHKVRMCYYDNCIRD